MWTFAIFSVVAVVLLGALAWIGHRQRRGDRHGAPGVGQPRTKASGTSGAYHREL
jgi:hypothetical protein